MSPVKVFEVAAKNAEVEQGEVEDSGEQFRIEWKHPTDATVSGHEDFVCYPNRVTSFAVLQLAGTDLGAIFKIFRQAMEPVDYARFEACCEDKTHEVEMDKLIEIVAWIAEVTTGVPGKGSSS